MDFSGTYELAPGQTRRIFSEGESLYVERNGKREQLLPEGSEIFFRKGVEGRILFRYADNGKVDALIDRRNNEDLVCRRMTSVKGYKKEGSRTACWFSSDKSRVTSYFESSPSFMPAIETSGLTKVYRTYRKERGLWGSIKGLVKRRYDETRAADHVSFNIEEGEFV